MGMEASDCFCQFLVAGDVLHSRELMLPSPNKSECRLTSIFSSQGGGLQYSAAPNNDFSDWVGQSQDFIAVNVGYRLGALGFMAHESLPSANAGLLDQRLALKWVKDNIGAFGGNPDDVTIMGQSGGGYAVVSQMALYDGASDGLFKKAIPRSVQRSPMFRISELADRTAKFASLLNCTSGQDQVECFQKASVPALVNAYANITRYIATSGYACVRLQPLATEQDH
jgi:carboxylesterase type B